VSVLNVAALLERSRGGGPGLRAVVWLQGCPRLPRCPGCFNRAMQDTERTVALLAPRSLAARLLAGPGLDGITLSGGEPFHQAAAAAELAAAVRARGLTVVTFSGHTLEELLRAARPEWLALLRETDLLVDGGYDETRPCREPLRASANQRLWFLSGRIRAADLEPADAVEVVIEPGGAASLSGAPAELGALRAALDDR
jgi:anaerobic ribonucleoside-triphosphate reductase activating protein